MAESWLVTVIVEPGVVHLSVPVLRGCAVAGVKQEMAKTDFTGTLKADEINLCSAAAETGGPEVVEPLSDSAVLTEGHSELSLCRRLRLSVPSGGFEEAYAFGVAGPAGSDAPALIEALRRHFRTKCRMKYCERIAIEIDSSSPCIEARVLGPDVLATMLLMELKKNHGEPLERCRRSPPPKPSPVAAPRVGPEAVSPDAFARNLDMARRACASWDGLRLIFLDIDGVLNRGSSMEGILPDLAQRLARLVLATDARIVLSSTWRFTQEGRMDVLAALVAAGLPLESIVGQTPEVSGTDMCSERADEIAAWIREAEPAAAWVALDDMDLPCDGPLQGHFVRTNVYTGLTEADVARAGRILKARP